MSIGDILDQIQKEIKICGNSIDTYYYKERRLCERPASFLTPYFPAHPTISEFLEIR